MRRSGQNVEGAVAPPRCSRALAVAVAAAMTAGCSLLTSFDHFDDDGGAASESDGGDGDDAGRNDGSAGGASDGGDIVADGSVSGINGCTSFIDRHDTTDDRSVSGPADSKPGRYDPACIWITTSELVSFQTSAFVYTDGDYWVAHPIEAYGGTEGSPIVTPTIGSSNQYTLFSSPGVFGFRCKNHPDQERGAILVKR